MFAPLAACVKVRGICTCTLPLESAAAADGPPPTLQIA